MRIRSTIIPAWLGALILGFALRRARRRRRAGGRPAEHPVPAGRRPAGRHHRGAWATRPSRPPTSTGSSATASASTGAYCMGSMGGAVCVPSRAMIHSGRTLFRVPTDLGGVTTLGQLLAANGYATFGTGKWHNGPPSFLRSFSAAATVFFGGMRDHTNVPVARLRPPTASRSRQADRRRVLQRPCSPTRPSTSSKRTTTTAPFFAYVAFTAPHDPRHGPRGIPSTVYDRTAVPLPTNFMAQHPFDNGWTDRSATRTLAPWPRTAPVDPQPARRLLRP